ncbi:predicted protein, partial [Nematostella vectensis]
SKQTTTNGSKEDISKTKSPESKKLTKTLLIIDSADHDWSKIFKGRNLHNGSYGIRVEQAEFADINLASYSDSGTMVDIQVFREGTVVVRSFRPDFVLVRQSIRGIGPREDYRHILLGLQFGNVPSVNSLESIYNFAEKPWVFSQLIQIKKRLGKEEFPLIEQAYYPNHKEMVSHRARITISYGCSNSVLGCILRIISRHYFSASLFRIFPSCIHLTVFPSRYSSLVFTFSIFANRLPVAHRRTSISDNWKTNTGSAVLEQIEITDRYKLWAEECSKLFGGLDIMCVEAILGKDKKEYIIEVTDTAMRLFNDTVDEDQQRIADLVIQKMEAHYPPTIQATSPTKAALSGENVKGLGES